MSNFHVHSYYSARDSIQSIQAIMDFQLSIGKDWFFITDHGTLANLNESQELVETYKKKNIDIAMGPGCEFYLKPDEIDDGKENIPKITNLKAVLKRKTEEFDGQKVKAKLELDEIMSNPMHNTKYFHITVLALTQEGLHNLYRMNNNGDFYYKHRVSMEDILKYNEGCVVLTGCPNGPVFNYIKNGMTDRADKWMKDLKEVYGSRCYFELMFHDGIVELKKDENETFDQYRERCIKEEIRIYKEGIKLARANDIKIIGTNDSHYTTKEDRRKWEITRIAMIGDKYDFSIGDYSMQENNSLFEKVYGIPEKELDDNEAEIISLLERDIKLPRSKYCSTHEDRAELERMVWTGFKNKRLGTPEERASLLKIPYELAVIQSKGYDKYFLVCKKIVKAGFESGVLIGPARGSAGGCEVTFMTDITKVDPIKYELLFERFLNPGRSSLPDVDIDFESTVCSNFEPTEEYFRLINEMFAREIATDEDIEHYWEMWKQAVKEEKINLRKEVFEKSPNATYFEGPVWKQPEDIIVVEDR